MDLTMSGTYRGKSVDIETCVLSGDPEVNIHEHVEEIRIIPDDGSEPFWLDDDDPEWECIEEKAVNAYWDRISNPD